MKKVTFAVFTDLHFDHIHDGKQRIKEFLTRIKSKNIDFIIQLGDLCLPKIENKFILDMLDTTGIPLYHVIGNHDSDQYPREDYYRFLNIDKSYYSFKVEDIKFIVLDSCYIKKEGMFIPYHKSYYNKSTDVYPILPDFELKWLKEQFNDDSKYYIIFSHHSLENEFLNRGISNRGEVRDIINSLHNDNTGKRVLLCMNGHDHGESIVKIDNSYYFGLNSMSYLWVGPQYNHFCYSNQIHKAYPFLKELVLYRESLHAIVTVNEEGFIDIEGIQGHYQNITPKELGIGDRWNGRPILPNISSITIK